MKIKKFLVGLLAIVFAISFVTMLFRKEYKLVIIKDIDAINLNDSIIYVRLYKDDNGPGVETKIKNFDTPFCFSGINHKLNLFYFDYAKKGDVIFKAKNSDSFSIKRSDTTIVFLLHKCP